MFAVRIPLRFGSEILTTYGKQLPNFLVQKISRVFVLYINLAAEIFWLLIKCGCDSHMCVFSIFRRCYQAWCKCKHRAKQYDFNDCVSLRVLFRRLWPGLFSIGRNIASRLWVCLGLIWNANTFVCRFSACFCLNLNRVLRVVATLICCQPTIRQTAHRPKTEINYNWLKLFMKVVPLWWSNVRIRGKKMQNNWKIKINQLIVAFLAVE